MNLWNGVRIGLIVSIATVFFLAQETNTSYGQGAEKFALVAQRSNLVVDEGVVFEAFTFNGTLPGPLIRVKEGDLVEITVQNLDGITHGLSIHAANTQTSQFVGNIGSGQTKTLTFTAEYPGVYMYHCAPGGHGIMTHTMAGMFGMIVVEPNAKYELEERLLRPPDIKVYVVQHELYSNGRDFFDGKPLYVMFNGYNYRYVNEPIVTRPGDYIRFYYLNVGPNLVSTFHAVGGVWNYVYYGGNPENRMNGTQSVISGPTDSWIVEWMVPAEGPFTLVSHAFGTQAAKGAIGVISSSATAPRVSEIQSEGPRLPLPTQPKRIVSPFGIGTQDVDWPVRFQSGQPVRVQIVGNSFYPKIAEVPVGTAVTWINEEVFDLLDGERTGKHDVSYVSGPQGFASPLLSHADSFRFTFTEPGQYEYKCTVHPYMSGRIVVYESGMATSADVSTVKGEVGTLRTDMNSVLSELRVPVYAAVVLGAIGTAAGLASLYRARTRKVAT